MKAILTIFIPVFLFIASAGASWMFLYPSEVVMEKESMTEGEDLLIDGEDSDVPEAMDMAMKQDAMPVASRPEAPITVEAVVELAQSIMEKEKLLFDGQQQLKKDEKRVSLLFEDLSREQEELEVFSKMIDEKIRQAKEAVNLLKLEKQAIMKEQAAPDSIEKRTGSTDEVAADDLNRRVKVVKSWFENLEPDRAAKYLKEFADRGDLEFVAKLLDSLEDRRIAKVLAAFNDATLVAKIVDTFTQQNKANKTLRR